MFIWYRLSADLGAFVGLAHEPSLGGSPQQSPGPSVCPFPMPAQYEEAKESKVQTVATLRNSIKSVSAPTFTIRCHGWLQTLHVKQLVHLTVYGEPNVLSLDAVLT